MLSFAAICPHPPLIIPTVGRENLGKAQKTVEAMEILGKELSEINPETIIIISPHGPITPHAFCLNLAEKYSGNFKMFGDLATKMEFKGDLELAYKIREKTEHSSPPFPLTMISEPGLDHGALVPLYYLTKKIKNFSVIPISYSEFSYEEYLNFGQLLKEEIVETNKKIAVIASGDLSHRLSPEAPAGYSPRGEEFDKKLIKLIGEKKIKEILELDPALIKEAGECGLRSILILLGILGDINYQPEILSYEGPFGVGYLVTNFKIN